MIDFLFRIVREPLKGGRSYWSWMGFLTLLTLFGVFCYYLQFKYGMLKTTGLGEEVSWGIYIANFAFLIGIAAAAVMLVIPGYIFKIEDIKQVVLVGESMAVAACLMAVLFIFASLGRPDRLWHILPFLGRINLPRSMLAWDVIVINSYLVINFVMLFYMLYKNYQGQEPPYIPYFLGVFVAIILAISIHTVTAFLFSSNTSRPFWHSAILGPRFLASAFTSGPALTILTLRIIRNQTAYAVEERVIRILALIMTVTLQINLFLLAVEFFTDFYGQTKHASSMQYLFFGLHGNSALVPWIWSSIGLNLVAVAILSIHPLRERSFTLSLACVLTIVGIWMEKGMGLVIPGFVPTPLGDVVEYTPTLVELGVMAGIWAFGTLIFISLVKIIIPVQMGEIAAPKAITPGRLPSPAR